jgi:glucose-6-phosphate 1-dehydrogenase
MTTATRQTATDPATEATIGDEGGPGSEPVTLLILGASGDLAGRLLMPGLGGLLAHEPARRVQLIGAGVEEYTDEQWQQRVSDSFASVEAHGPAVDALLGSTRYVTADVTSADALTGLLAACEAPPAIYFALPPAVTEKARRSPSRSRSAPTSRRPSTSTGSFSSSSPRNGCTASTTSSAGRPCSTCSGCASRTA